MKRNILYIVILLLGWGCTYEFPDTDVQLSSGSADFSKFVCVGDNFTAGFMDGALYSAGQINSIGSLVALQLEDVTISSFYQADINSENGYNPISSGPSTYGKMVMYYPSISSDDPVITMLPGEIPGPYDGDLGLLTDFSILFLKSYQIDQPELSANAYYNRIANNPGTSTLLDQINASSPSFFLLWAGMYDALHFATSGALGDSNPPSDPALINEKDLTPEDVFENSIRQLITTLLSNPQAKGIVVNLPSFDDLPFFYHYPYNFIQLSNSRLSSARQNYADFNLAVTLHNQVPGNDPRPYIDFNDNGLTEYPQPLVVYDDSLADGIDLYGDPLPKIRHLKLGEMVLLSLPFEEVENGLGWYDPLPKEYYLNFDDISVLEVATGKYNDILSEIVVEYSDRLSLVDLNTPIDELAATGKIDAWGIPESFDIKFIDGLPIKADISMNSAFSLDGLHFNPRGNAYVANLIIDAINLNFGSNILHLEVNQFIGNTVVPSK